jgi:hypothetical protein
MSEAGTLFHGENAYGEIEINRKGDHLFAEELAEFLQATKARSKAARDVHVALQRTRAITAVQVLVGGGRRRTNIAHAQRLFGLLAQSRPGLLHDDAKGFQLSDGKFLSVEVGG